MVGSSRIELSFSALQNNVDYLRKQFGEHIKLSSVVKANAYGHGIEKFVPMAEQCGIDHFSVFSAEEAARVYKIKKPTTDVMIMGWVANRDLKWVIKHDIDFTIFEYEKIKEAIEICKKLKKPAKIHIELETGMNRTGLDTPALKQVVRLINEFPDCFIIKGLCTHYAGAESIANHVRVKKQLSRFNRIHKWLNMNGVNPEIRHTACSAAAMTYPNTRMDMIRVGILFYGFWPSRETLIQHISRKKEKKDPLMRVISWKSEIMSLKNVRQGQFVSYGTSYLAHEDMKIAIVPVGYSDGYNRSLSNMGRVLIHGTRAAVIGIVNMNMLIVEVTQIPGVQIGDEVVIVGNQGDLSITIASFSEFSSTLNYELLARLPANIKRIVIN